MASPTTTTMVQQQQQQQQKQQQQVQAQPPQAVRQNDEDAIVPYSMHVSSRYLELTRKKLELTRLPRELDLPEPQRWDHGTPKSVLEPLLDFWLEGYSWRAAEQAFNASLPQYRTNITIPTSSSTAPGSPHTAKTPTSPSSPAASSPTGLASGEENNQALRIHFVHKKSSHANAVPLLIIHSWPSSFIEVQRVIEALTEPLSLPSFGQGAGMGFSVVAPSIPGFGFSDASPDLEFGINGTADAFDGLMGKLGYERYVVHGVGWGFHIARALATRHPKHCLAVHTANPTFSAPEIKKNPLASLKYTIAKITRSRFPGLSFGYLPTDLHTHPSSSDSTEEQKNLYSSNPLTSSLHRLYSSRPQTLSFSLCDSPVGLLAALLDVIHTRNPSGSPLTSRSRSPFLSPVELEMQEAGSRNGNGNGNGNGRVTEELGAGSVERPPRSPYDGERDAKNYTWSPTEVLNWTMMQWLPGPESSLRWLRQAHIDVSNPGWNNYCSVPLGISSFQSRNSNKTTPLMWGSTSWNISWIRRHQRPATLPAWEAPDLLVLDLRECFGTFLSQGKLVNLPHREG